ncbi:MAG TPA: DUF3515 domain-containing protein [Blastococcus sp.]|nr:DUF3515 domain-containing protein [Blastococcus sp.]
MPVVVAVIVLVHVLGGGAGNGTATVAGPTSSPRAELPVLPVDVPPVTPQADAGCPALMRALPSELMRAPSRRVKSASPFAHAWGDPAVVLVCGVAAPAGFVRGASAIQINGVQWYVDTSAKDTTVWTTVDRPVNVEVRVPASVDSAPVTSLTTQIAATLPFREPTPGK